MSSLIDRVRERSDEVGECWEWQDSSRRKGETPRLQINKKRMYVRRALAIEVGLLAADSAKFAAPKCRNWRCVNPDHIQVITHKALNKRLAQNRVGGKLATSRKASDSRRKRAKLTIDQAREIRTSEMSMRKLAARYGVDYKTIWLIKQGHIWKDYSGVFAQLVGVVT